MILKSLSRSTKSNPGYLVHYLLQYATKEKGAIKDKEEATVIFRHRLQSESISDMKKEFEKNEAFRIYKRKDSVALYHHICSFSPKSNSLITNEKLKVIAKKFIQLRAPDSLSLTVAHQGKTKHPHLHVIVAGVKLNGYSSRVSKDHFKHIKLEMEKFIKEKFPELEHSAIEHIKEPDSKIIQQLETLKKSRQKNKASIHQLLGKVFEKAISQEDFLNKLNTCNIKPYYRNSKIQGVVSGGLKYRFSKLGFDEIKFDELNNREQISKTSLSEFDQIRLKKEPIKQKEIEENETKKQELGNDESMILNEISNIRLRTKSRDLSLQGFSLDNS